MKLHHGVAVLVLLGMCGLVHAAANTRVSGKVQYADGTAAANLTVQLLRAKPIERAESIRPRIVLMMQRGGASPDEEVVATVRTGADGQFVFNNVAPGAYSVLAGGGRAGFARQRIVVEADKPLELQLKTPRAQA